MNFASINDSTSKATEGLRGHTDITDVHLVSQDFIRNIRDFNHSNDVINPQNGHDKFEALRSSVLLASGLYHNLLVSSDDDHILSTNQENDCLIADTSADVCVLT